MRDRFARVLRVAREDEGLGAVEGGRVADPFSNLAMSALQRGLFGVGSLFGGLVLCASFW